MISGYIFSLVTGVGWAAVFLISLWKKFLVQSWFVSRKYCKNIIFLIWTSDESGAQKDNRRLVGWKSLPVSLSPSWGFCLQFAPVASLFCHRLKESVWNEMQEIVQLNGRVSGDGNMSATSFVGKETDWFTTSATSCIYDHMSTSCNSYVGEKSSHVS